jgi:hypothetical protein
MARKERNYDLDLNSHMEEATESVERVLKEKRLTARDPRKLRNLAQYKNMTDEQFEERMIQKEQDVEPSREFEKRIQMKLNDFAKDYDISDLKINDRETLRALIQAVISLEDYEQILFKMKMSNGVNMDSLVLFDKINKIMSDLRSDISKLQDDLKISRKIRKNDQETSVLTYLENLKLKAKRFYEQKSMQVICPECKTLVATVWTLYPEQNNKLELTCKRELGDGKTCKTKIQVSTRDMLKTRGCNVPDVLPETLLQ